MQITTMKLSELRKPEKNVRIHTSQQLKEFERSITMFGQIRPIVIDENNMIMAGNGLYDTLLAMGRDTAEVYKYENLTENQKKKLMIADNKIFNLGVENLEVLNEFFEDLKDDLDIPGFDEDILKEMVADAEEVTESIMEYGKLDRDEIEAIKTIGEKQEERAERAEIESKTNESDSIVPENGEKQKDKISNEAMTDERTDVQKFVICPKCGEKIWL